MLCSCRAGFVGDSISVYQVAWGQPAKGSQEPRWGWVHWPLDGSSSPPWDPNRPLLRRSAAAAAWQATWSSWGLKSFCAKKSARVSSAAAEKIMHLHRLLLYYVQLLNAAQRSGGGIHPRLFQLHPRFQSDRCYLKKSDFKDFTSKAKINLNFVSDNLI